MSKRERTATAAPPASSDLAPTKHAGWRGLFGAPLLIAAVAVFIVAVDNDPFWQGAWRATQNDEHRLAILSTLCALIFVPLTVTMAIAVGTKLLRVVAALLLLVAASCGFFMIEYGRASRRMLLPNFSE